MPPRAHPGDGAVQAALAAGRHPLGGEPVATRRRGHQPPRRRIDANQGIGTMTFSRITRTLLSQRMSATIGPESSALNPLNEFSKM